MTSIVDKVNRPETESPQAFRAQCFQYDDFNRLAAAWTDFATSAEALTCASAAPVVGDTSWSEGGDSEGPGGTGHADTAYATGWSYSDSGRITSISNLVADAALVKTFDYDEQDAFHAVKSVESQTKVVVSDDFITNAYTGSSGWATGWVESGDDGSASTGLVSVADAMVTFTGVASPGANAVLSRDLDVTDQVTAEVSVNVAHGVLELDSSDSFRVTVTNDADPAVSVSQTITGDMISAWDAGNPTSSVTPVTVNATSLLPATTLTVSLEVVTGVTDTDTVDVEQVLVTDVTLTLTEDINRTDTYTYDDAGRMTSRTVDGVVTTFDWDVSSNLVKTTEVDGTVETSTTYVYDAGGQRVARIGDTAKTATAYFGDTEINDPNTTPAVTNDLTATRYYAFAGATVAMKDADGLKYLIGDIQGSATFTMLDVRDPVTDDPDWAELTITRNAYTPYGAIRGADNLTTDRGWLGQIEDDDTGLMYLNARYYDPTIGRFLSPDPLMNPGDPRTLDPYRYADNNPVLYSDASGMAPHCSIDLYPDRQSNGDCYYKYQYGNQNGSAILDVVRKTYYTPAPSGPAKVAGPGQKGDAARLDLPPITVPGANLPKVPSALIAAQAQGELPYKPYDPGDDLFAGGDDPTIPPLSFGQFMRDFVVEGVPYFVKHHGDDALAVVGVVAFAVCVAGTGGGCLIVGALIATGTVAHGLYYEDMSTGEALLSLAVGIGPLALASRVLTLTSRLARLQSGTPRPETVEIVTTNVGIGGLSFFQGALCTDEEC